MIIPPRCRKARPVAQHVKLEIPIKEITAADAPVAIEVESYDEVKQYRWYGRKLYHAYKPHSKQTAPSIPGDKHFPADRSFLSYELSEADDEASARKLVKERFKGFLIIDGEVYHEASEPVYRIMTFGLGGDGSVSLTTDHEIMAGSPAGSGYYRADEYELAKQHAIKTASRWGDKNLLATIDDREERIRVFIDEAIRFKSKTWRQQRYQERKTLKQQLDTQRAWDKEEINRQAQARGMSQASLMLDT